MTAKINSTISPTAYETITRGKTFIDPIIKLSNVRKFPNRDT